MAGVTKPGGTLTQIGLVALLRLRIARNSLGSFSAKVDLAVKILVILRAGLSTLGIGAALVAISHGTARASTPARNSSSEPCATMRPL